MTEQHDNEDLKEHAKRVVETAKKDKLGVARLLTRLAVGHSVSTTLVSLVHQNTEVSTPIQKAKLYIGAYFVGQIVADLARDRVDASFDELVKTIESIKSHEVEETPNN